MTMKLKKGDRVLVIPGKDIGKRGEVTRVYPDRDKVIVDELELINVAKKHQKPTRATMQGGIIDKDDADPRLEPGARLRQVTGRTRIGYRFDDDGKKVRVCRKCGKEL